MGDGKIVDEEEVALPRPELPDREEWLNRTTREYSLAQAVKARVPNAGADEIVTAAKTFEDYLTGKTDEHE
jgi:hypothetical protein